MEDNGLSNTSDISQTQQGSAVQTTEKMVPQSQVNEIVGNAKREAAERAVEAYRQQQTRLANESQNASQFNTVSSARNLSEDDIKRVTDGEIKRHFEQLQQEAQERVNVAEANRVVNLFKEKIVAGKDKYDDFEPVAGNVAMQYYPNVVQLLAEHVDNAADVLYYLAKNRTKLHQLESTCAHNAPDAIYDIKRLSESIKDNEQSSQVKHSNAPLSQQRPSNTGTGSGALSMSDLKRKYRG